MSKFQRDHIAETIADYEAMKDAERGKLLGRIMEDQPMLMGFLTNLADDFSDSEHEALVDSTVIVINAFVASGIPIKTVPDGLIKEVIEEKVDKYENRDPEDLLDPEALKDISDSPLVFEDLRNRALFKSDLKKDNPLGQQNFLLILDAILTMIERMAATVIEEKEEARDQ